MIDSHCHLDSRQFEGKIDELVTAATETGVHTIVNIGADLPSSIRSVELAEQFDPIYAAVGVHPHDASTLDNTTLQKIKELASHHKVRAIGEIGLDYYRDLSPRSIQKKAFIRQLELAVELAKPIVIHTREAFEDTLAIVRDHASDLPGGVFHCFPGSTDDAFRVFELGFVISVGGIITYKNAHMAQVASEVPLEQIMIETDAPYLAPVPHRGKLNEPAYVLHVRDKLAELRQISPDEVEKITDRTSRKLYRLVETFGE
jgi:TatD DNase family protein